MLVRGFALSADRRIRLRALIEALDRALQRSNKFKLIIHLHPKETQKPFRRREREAGTAARARFAT
jgi:hypothetical protein